MHRDYILEQYLKEVKLMGYENGNPLTQREEGLIKLFFERGWEHGKQATLEEVKEIVNETNPLKRRYYQRRYGQ